MAFMPGENGFQAFCHHHLSHPIVFSPIQFEPGPDLSGIEKFIKAGVDHPDIFARKHRYALLLE
jgi:hypothetical protein